MEAQKYNFGIDGLKRGGESFFFSGEAIVVYASMAFV